MPVVITIASPLQETPSGDFCSGMVVDWNFDIR
jgi:hypothetical protein